MTNRYNAMLVWDKDDQIWVAYIPTLNWLSTYGETREEALEQATEAALGYLEAAAKEGIEVPPADSSYSRAGGVRDISTSYQTRTKGYC